MFKDDPNNFRVEGSLVLNRASGNGIKLGDITNKNYKFGWADITSNIEVRGVQATDPSWAQIGSGPFYAYKFGVGDYVWMTYHVPHDFLPKAPIHFHTHWLTDGTDTNPLKWEFVYTYATGFDQAAFDPTGTTVTVEQAASGTAYQHMVRETDAIPIGIGEPDGLIHVRVGRITNGATDNTDDVFMLTADIHYQTTGIKGTRNRIPGFYDE